MMPMSKTAKEKANKKKSLSFLNIQGDLYEAVIKNALEGFIILSLEGDILDVNEAFSKMHGYSRDELLSMKVYDLAPTKITLNDYTELIKDHIKMGGANFETQHRCKDGSIIDVMVSSKYLDVGGGVFFSFHRDVTGQKRKEKKEHKHLERTREALKISDERLGTVVDSISEVIILLDEDGRYIDIITGSEELLYNEREKIIGLLLHDALPKDIADAGLKAIKKAIKTSKTQTIEYKLDVPAGERWFEGRISPLKSKSDKKLVVMVARDITEHKQMDDQIRESESQYRTLIELGTKIGEAVVMLQDVEGKEGLHVYVSEQWPKITGYSREELLDASFFCLVSPKDKEVSIQRHWQKMAGETIPDLFELTIIRKDGEEVPVEITSAVTNYQCKPTNVVYIRDVSERKKLENDLLEEKYHYQTLFESTPIAMLEEQHINKKQKISELGFTNIEDIVNYYYENPHEWVELISMKEDDSHRFFNSALLELFDVNNISEFDSMIQKKFLKAAQTLKDTGSEIYNLKQKITAQINLVMGTGECAYDDYFYTCKGKWRHIHVNLLRLPCDYNHQDRIRTVLSSKDISEYVNIKDKLYYYMNKLEEIVRERTKELSTEIEVRKRTEENLANLYVSEQSLRKQVEAQIEQRIEYTRALIHELKTPLTPMLVASSFLVENLDGAPKEFAEAVIRSGRKLEKRVNELIDISKGEVGLLSLQCNKIDIIKLLNNIVKEVETRIEKRGLVLATHFPRYLPVILGDEARIEQVILNLIDNAVKFNRNKGNIAISATTTETDIIISVSDTGIGIDPKQIDCLFQPYKLLEKKGNDEGGLGLGLALSKMFVEMHNGRIWLDSKEGEGSTFSFSLPIPNKAKKGKK